MRRTIPARDKPKFSSADIVFAVRRLHKADEPLNISAVREKHPDLLLAAYSQPRFLGWHRALELAGVDYSKIKIRLRECIRCLECGRRFMTLRKHMATIHGMSVEEYQNLHPKAPIRAEACFSRGMPSKQHMLPHWEPVWTPEYVLDRIYEFHRRGIPLNSSTLADMDQRTVARARHYFRSWEAAIQLIGLDPRKHMKHAPAKKWTRPEVVHAIMNRYKRGDDVSRSGMDGYDSRIVSGAVRLFGTYDQAIRACGLDPVKTRKAPKPPRRYKSEDDVIRGICRRRFMEQPLHDCGLRIGPHKDLSLWNKGRRLFGTWSKAVEAAGFNYGRICPKAPKYATATDVVSAIQIRRRQDLPLTATGVRRGSHKDPNLYNRGCKFFRNWAGVLKAAGIDQKSVLSVRVKYGSKESVIEEIRRREHLRLPLNYMGIRHDTQERDLCLYSSALKLFGCWADAIEQAGAKVRVARPGGRYPTKEDVLEGIRRRHAKGLSLSTGALGKGVQSDRALLAKALSLFGHWRDAVEAAGVKYISVLGQPRKYPTKESVIAEIRRRHGAGLTLRPGEMGKSQNSDAALYVTGRREFGSWEKALRVALHV